MNVKITKKDYIVHGIYFLLYGLFKYFPPPVGSWLRNTVTRVFAPQSRESAYMKVLPYGTLTAFLLERRSH